MARIKQVTGYHVRVEYRTPTWARLFREESLAHEKSECERIIAEIARHVDDARAALVAETQAVCSHCGAPWTEDSDTYNGGCCDEDQEAHEAACREAA